MEWKHRRGAGAVRGAGSLETFLSGMETQLPNRINQFHSRLETFLSGMETSDTDLRYANANVP